MLAESGEHGFPDLEARRLFLLGNQGPDPFFYALLTGQRKRMLHIGNLMQGERIDESLDAFRELIATAPTDRRFLLDAYFCGYLCHFVLDRVMHPFVDAQAERGCAWDDPGDAGSDKRSSHTYIEVEFDAMMLRRAIAEVGDSGDGYRFLKGIPAASKTAVFDTGTLYARLAEAVYGEVISPKTFYRRVRDMRLVNAFLYSSRRGKRPLFAKIESYLFTGSFARTQQQRDGSDDSCIFCNTGKHTWLNPHTGTQSNESFDELLARALKEAGTTITSHRAGAPSRALSTGLDFGGKPTPA